MQYSYQLS